MQSLEARMASGPYGSSSTTSRVLGDTGLIITGNENVHELWSRIDSGLIIDNQSLSLQYKPQLKTYLQRLQKPSLALA
jgi:hypothetical protein